MVMQSKLLSSLARSIVFNLILEPAAASCLASQGVSSCKSLTVIELVLCQWQLSKASCEVIICASCMACQSLFHNLSHLPHQGLISSTCLGPSGGLTSYGLQICTASKLQCSYAQATVQHVCESIPSPSRSCQDTPAVRAPSAACHKRAQEYSRLHFLHIRGFISTRPSATPEAWLAFNCIDCCCCCCKQAASFAWCSIAHDPTYCQTQSSCCTPATGLKAGKSLHLRLRGGPLVGQPVS